MKLIKSKKAQMEIIGLVVIVILISVGMLFLTKFALQDEPDKKIFTRKELAASTMAALMKATAPDCKGSLTSIPQVEKQLLEDCAVLKLNPGADSNYQCTLGNGLVDSCNYLKAKLTEILETTLGKWGKSYELRTIIVKKEGTLKGDEVLTIVGKDGCTAKERDTSGNFFIPSTKLGLIQSVLYVCE